MSHTPEQLLDLTSSATRVNEVIEFPAKTVIVIESDEPIEFPLNSPFASPRQTRNHGELWYEFRLGTDADYCLRNHDDPTGKSDEVWVNACATVLSAERQQHRFLLGLRPGTRIVHQGQVYRLEPAPNNNLRAVPC